MSARTPDAAPSPPPPLTAEQRTSAAYLRARGHDWDAVGASLRREWLDLRRAAEADPLFPAALESARAEATWEAEGDALQRLRLLIHAEDEVVGRRACEVLLAHARDRRRDETRLAVERLRADAQRARAEAQKARAARREAVEEEWAPPVVYPRPTEEDRAELRERSSLEYAARPQADVYLWGGRHSIGRCVPPDESDTPVRVVTDYSVGHAPRGTYWVVPAHVYEAAGRGARDIHPSDLAAPPLVPSV